MSNLHGTSEHVCEFGAGISCVACSKAALSQPVIANCRKLASHVALEQLPDLSYGSLYTGSAAPIALGTGATCQTPYMVDFWSMRALRWWPRTITCDSYPPVSWRLNCANLAAHNLSQRALSHEQPTWHQRACLRVWRGDKLCSLLKSSFVPTCHRELSKTRVTCGFGAAARSFIRFTVHRFRRPHCARHRRHMPNALHGGLLEYARFALVAPHRRM